MSPAPPPPRRPLVRLALAVAGLAMLVALALVVLASTVAARMRALELQAVQVQAELHRMRHAGRALLSARSPFDTLVADWRGAVDGFTRALDQLELGARGRFDAGIEARLAAVAADWEEMRAEIAPVDDELARLAGSSLAATLGDLGLEQTWMRLVEQPGSGAELSRLRRVQRHLGAFERMEPAFARNLGLLAEQVGGSAGRWSGIAFAIAAALAVAVLAIGGWLSWRLLWLGMELRREAAARAESEDRLRRAQAMEAIGQIAGGVAHDFNNMLTGIIGSAELLSQRLADRPDLRRKTDLIVSAGTRAAALTRQLLDFSRRSAMQHAHVDLNQVARETIGLLGRSLGGRVEAKLELARDPAWVAGDPAQLQNVLVNLAVNARDAMPEGGELAVATRLRREDAPFAHGGRTLGAGAWIELTVADTGGGIPADILPRIFEPFFTTKEVGRGSGLGLAAVLGSVERHGGAVGVESRPGRTVFTILLPASGPPGSTETPAPPDGADLAGRRVLVVDDESGPREVAAAMLERCGCQVRQAADADAAERLLRQSPCDLVVLDVVMPGRGGREALAALRAICPGLPVLFWSGYAAGTEVDDLLADGATGFISKPPSSEALIGAATGLIARQERSRRRA